MFLLSGWNGSVQIRKHNERHERDNEIINEIKNNKGTQFDPKIADIMLKLIDEGEIKIGD